MLWLTLGVSIGCGGGDDAPGGFQYDAGTDLDGDGDTVACRSTQECRPTASGEERQCEGPNAFVPCGIAPHEKCVSDLECLDGDLCHAVDDVCSPDHVGSECRPACGQEAPCDPGFRCNVDGRCEAIPCDEGYACESHQRCDPAVIPAAAPIFDRHHGCNNQTCSDDGDCPAGMFCVSDMCQESLGVCRVPEPVA